MWRLVLRGIVRHRLRAGLVIGGLAIPVAMLVVLSSFGSSYERSLRSELNRMGVHLMVVPIGCPYDAAARVVKGRSLDHTLPASALEEVRADPAVAIAAPLLIIAVPRQEENRVDIWVGLEESSRALKPWWKAQSGAEVERLIDRVKLRHRREHKPNELSGGEMQRVAIARALVHHPLILLADEPTGNLDTATGESLIQLLKELHTGGLTIVLVTHNPTVAAVAQRTIMLRDGRVVEG